MAFFGLTALGPQNTFARSAIHHRTLQIFEENDFLEAWNKALANSPTGTRYCDHSQLDSILERLYHGPVPEIDYRPIKDAFEMIDDGRGAISIDSYIKVMLRLQRQAEQDERGLEGKTAPICEFTSISDFRESLRKNAAIKVDAQKKLHTPLTATQEYGWDKQDLKGPVAGRHGSDITHFASELIKNGIYY